MTVGPLPEPGPMVFATAHVYDSGETVRWSERERRRVRVPAPVVDVSGAVPLADAVDGAVESRAVAAIDGLRRDLAAAERRSWWALVLAWVAAGVAVVAAVVAGRRSTVRLGER